MLAGVLFELAQERQHSMHQRGSARVFPPITPQVVSWNALRGTVAKELQSQIGKSIENVTFGTWIPRVRKDIESGAVETALMALPAAELLDFYEGLLPSGDGAPNRLDATEVMRRSQKLREMKVIKEDWMRKWIRKLMVSRK